MSHSLLNIIVIIISFYKDEVMDQEIYKDIYQKRTPSPLLYPRRSRSLRNVCPFINQSGTSAEYRQSCKYTTNLSC